MTRPQVSVIVPTHNRRASLPRLLASLARQDYPANAWEVIIVDDGSTDGTRAYLETGVGPGPPRTRHLSQEQQGAPGARNTGAALACGRVLLFLDDDMIAAPHLVAAHARMHAADAAAVAIGHLSTPTHGRAGWMTWEDAKLGQHYARLDSGARTPGPRDFFSGNCSVPALLFRAVGGYNAQLRRTEDLELGYRLQAAGGHFYYAPAARSLHLGTHSFESWLGIARTYGESDVRLAREQGHSVIGEQLAVWFAQRQPLNRALVRLARRWPILQYPAIWTLHLAGHLAGALRARRAVIACYSAINNLAYWMGVLEGLAQTDMSDPLFLRTRSAAGRRPCLRHA